MTDYPRDAVGAVFDSALSKDRRPKKLSTRAQHAIDALADVLEVGDMDAADRVALEDARATLEKYAEEPPS